RGLLYRALRDEAARRGVQIVAGKRLAAVEQTGTAVCARFEDGTDAAGTMLVGADGLHSMTRRLIDPAAPGPRYTGLLSLGGHAVSRTLEPTPDVFNMIFGKRAFFGYTVRPSGDVYWFANTASAEQPGRDPSAAISGAAWKDRLRDLFA